MKKISTRLWVLMLLLISITFILLWIFQIEFFDTYYTKGQITNVKREAEKLSLIIANQNKESIDNAMDELTVKYNAAVDVYDINGKMLYSTEMGRGMMGFNKNSIISDALAGKTTQVQMSHRRFNTNILYLGMPVKADNIIQGAVVITLPLTPVKETADILKKQLQLIMIILISVSFVLAFIFSKTFTKPILKINNAAAEMAAGNLAVKLDITSKDELGMLAQTITNLSTQLQKIEKLRREFISNVSHEFRTPLSIIKGYAETIRDVSSENLEKRNKQLEIIIEESDRLKLMVDEILNLSQLQADYFKLNITEFDAFDTVKSVVNKFSYTNNNVNIDLLSMENDKSTVIGDEERIEQVLYNLISNAIKNSPPDSRIQIKLSEKDEAVLIEVIDEGYGIAEEDLPYIWDRFFKGDKAEDREYQGNGLGLSIVKTILEAHKCKFGVESKKNKGTRFWFSIKSA